MTTDSRSPRAHFLVSLVKTMTNARAPRQVTNRPVAQAGYLARFATALRELFGKKKTDAGSDIALGDQVRLPQEFLENLRALQSSRKSD